MHPIKRALVKAIVGKRNANSIFGTLGENAHPITSHMGFIPLDGQGRTLKLVGNEPGGNPIWLGLEGKMMKFWAYVFCSPLASVIDRLAEADTNGVVNIIDEETKVPIKRENLSRNPKLYRLKKLLKKPNPWQTWEEYDAEQVVFCKIFGYCPVFAVGPAGFDKSHTKALININPLYTTPVGNTLYDINGTDPMIKEWIIGIAGKSYTIPSSDILVIKDGFVTKTASDLGLPMSKVEGMDFFVSNICAAMEANNVILKRKGPLGIFSWDPQKDMAGTTPFEPNDKDELQADLARYGLTIGQLQHVISKMPIKWNAISFNLRDLMTKEIIRDGIDGICDRFGYPAELMSGKNATYENRDSSEKFLYQNNIIPFSLRRMTKYNNFFDLDGAILSKNFNHLPVLQEDIVKAGEASKYESEGLQIEWESGMITWNQWQIKKERDPVEGMDIYYPEYIKKFPQMNKNKPLEKSNTTKDDKKPASQSSGTKK